MPTRIMYISYMEQCYYKNSHELSMNCQLHLHHSSRMMPSLSVGIDVVYDFFVGLSG